MSAQAGYSLGVFRSSAWHYTLGRVANALMSVAIFLWLARGLAAADYAAYVVAVATIEILLVASVLGMDWVTAVQIPKLRLAGAGRQLARLVGGAFAVQAAALAVLGVLLYVGAVQLANALGHAGHATLFELYALVLVIEGCSRVFRDQILTSLLMQGVSQLAQALRNGALLLYLAYWAMLEQPVDLLGFARMEVMACGASLLLGAAFASARVWRERAGDTGANAPRPDVPGMRTMALSAWLAAVTGMLWSGQMVVLVASRMLGPEVAGLIGFARNLVEQVRRLMPVEFLFGLIRPLLAVRFAADGSIQALLRRTALLLKLNLLCLLPALLLAVAHGDSIAAWVSAGRYPQAHWMLVGWLAWVLIWSSHRLADNSAHLLGYSRVVGRTALMLLLALPMYALAAALGGAAALLAALVLAESAYVSTVWRRAVPGGLCDLPWGILRPARLLALLLIVLAAAALCRDQPAWLSASVMGAAYLGSAALLRLASVADLRAVVAESAERGAPVGALATS
jgi:hypothetical protein